MKDFSGCKASDSNAELLNSSVDDYLFEDSVQTDRHPDGCQTRSGVDEVLRLTLPIDLIWGMSSPPAIIKERTYEISKSVTVTKVVSGAPENHPNSCQVTVNNHSKHGGNPIQVKISNLHAHDPSKLTIVTTETTDPSVYTKVPVVISPREHYGKVMEVVEQSRMDLVEQFPSQEGGVTIVFPSGKHKEEVVYRIPINQHEKKVDLIEDDKKNENIGNISITNGNTPNGKHPEKKRRKKYQTVYETTAESVTKSVFFDGRQEATFNKSSDNVIDVTFATPLPFSGQVFRCSTRRRSPASGGKIIREQSLHYRDDDGLAPSNSGRRESAPNTESVDKGSESEVVIDLDIDVEFQSQGSTEITLHPVDEETQTERPSVSTVDIPGKLGLNSLSSSPVSLQSVHTKPSVLDSIGTEVVEEGDLDSKESNKENSEEEDEKTKFFRHKSFSGETEEALLEQVRRSVYEVPATDITDKIIDQIFASINEHGEVTTDSGDIRQTRLTTSSLPSTSSSSSWSVDPMVHHMDGAVVVDMNFLRSTDSKNAPSLAGSTTSLGPLKPRRSFKHRMKETYTREAGEEPITSTSDMENSLHSSTGSFAPLKPKRHLLNSGASSPAKPPRRGLKILTSTSDLQLSEGRHTPLSPGSTSVLIEDDYKSRQPASSNASSEGRKTYKVVSVTSTEHEYVPVEHLSVVADIVTRRRDEVRSDNGREDRVPEETASENIEMRTELVEVKSVPQEEIEPRKYTEIDLEKVFSGICLVTGEQSKDKRLCQCNACQEARLSVEEREQMWRERADEKQKQRNRSLDISSPASSRRSVEEFDSHIDFEEVFNPKSPEVPRKQPPPEILRPATTTPSITVEDRPTSPVEIDFEQVFNNKEPVSVTVKRILEPRDIEVTSGGSRFTMTKPAAPEKPKEKKVYDTNIDLDEVFNPSQTLSPPVPRRRASLVLLDEDADKLNEMGLLNPPKSPVPRRRKSLMETEISGDLPVSSSELSPPKPKRRLSLIGIRADSPSPSERSPSDADLQSMNNFYGESPETSTTNNKENESYESESTEVVLRVKEGRTRPVNFSNDKRVSAEILEYADSLSSEVFHGAGICTADRDGDNCECSACRQKQHNKGQMMKLLQWAEKQNDEPTSSKDGKHDILDEIFSPSQSSETVVHTDTSSDRRQPTIPIDKSSMPVADEKHQVGSEKSDQEKDVKELDYAEVKFRDSGDRRSIQPLASFSFIERIIGEETPEIVPMPTIKEEKTQVTTSVVREPAKAMLSLKDIMKEVETDKQLAEGPTPNIMSFSFIEDMVNQSMQDRPPSPILEQDESAEEIQHDSFITIPKSDDANKSVALEKLPETQAHKVAEYSGSDLTQHSVTRPAEKIEQSEINLDDIFNPPKTTFTTPSKKVLEVQPKREMTVATTRVMRPVERKEPVPKSDLPPSEVTLDDIFAPPALDRATGREVITESMIIDHEPSHAAVDIDVSKAAELKSTADYKGSPEDIPSLRASDMSSADIDIDAVFQSLPSNEEFVESSWLSDVIQEVHEIPTARLLTNQKAVEMRETTREVTTTEVSSTTTDGEQTPAKKESSESTWSDTKQEMHEIPKQTRRQSVTPHSMTDTMEQEPHSSVFQHQDKEETDVPGSTWSDAKQEPYEIPQLSRRHSDAPQSSTVSRQAKQKSPGLPASSINLDDIFGTQVGAREDVETTTTYTTTEDTSYIIDSSSYDAQPDAAHDPSMRRRLSEEGAVDTTIRSYTRTMSMMKNDNSDDVDSATAETVWPDQKKYCSSSSIISGTPPPKPPRATTPVELHYSSQEDAQETTTSVTTAYWRRETSLPANSSPGMFTSELHKDALMESVISYPSPSPSTPKDPNFSYDVPANMSLSTDDVFPEEGDSKYDLSASTNSGNTVTASASLLLNDTHTSTEAEDDDSIIKLVFSGQPKHENGERLGSKVTTFTDIVTTSSTRSLPALPEEPTASSSRKTSPRSSALDISTNRQEESDFENTHMIANHFKHERIEVVNEHHPRDEELLEVEVSSEYFIIKGNYSIVINRSDPLGVLLESLQQGHAGNCSVSDMASLDFSLAPKLRKLLYSCLKEKKSPSEYPSLSHRAQQLICNYDSASTTYQKMFEDHYDEETNPKGNVNLCTAENNLCEELVLRRAQACLSVLQPQFGPSDTKQLEHLVHYGPAGGYMEIKQTLLQYFQKFMNANRVTTQDLVVAPGCNSAYDMISFTAFETDDIILTTSPVYARVFNNIEERSHCKVVAVPLKTIHKPVLDIKAYQEAIDQYTDQGETVKGLVIINPHNPLGVVFPPDEVIRVCNWANDQNLFVIVDEIFSGSVYAENSLFESFLSYRHRLNNPNTTAWMWSPSKDFGLPGVKLSAVVCSDPAIVRALTRLEVLQPSSALAQNFITRLLDDHEWITSFNQRKIARLRVHRSFVEQQLRLLNIPFVEAVAGVCLLCDFRKFISKPYENEDALLSALAADGVFLSPGKHMGMVEDGWLRIVFACKKEELREGLLRLSKFFGNTLPIDRIVYPDETPSLRG